MRWHVTIAALLASGCSLPFDGIGAGGSEQRVSAAIYRIAVPATGLPDRTSVHDYTLLKAAETTKRIGGTHFMVISGADVQPAGLPPMASPAPNSGAVPYAAYIKVLTLDPAEIAPSGALSVEETLHFLGKRPEKDAS